MTPRLKKVLLELLSLVLDDDREERKEVKPAPPTKVVVHVPKPSVQVRVPAPKVTVKPPAVTVNVPKSDSQPKGQADKPGPDGRTREYWLRQLRPHNVKRTWPEFLQVTDFGSP